MLLGSRLDPAWTDLPVSAGFMPFMDALVNRLARGEVSLADGAPGDPVPLPDLVTEVRQGERDWRVEGGGVFRPERPRRVLPAGRADTVGAISANLDPRESLLAPASDGQVRRLVEGARRSSRWPTPETRPSASRRAGRPARPAPVGRAAARAGGDGAGEPAGGGSRDEAPAGPRRVRPGPRDHRAGGAAAGRGPDAAPRRAAGLERRGAGGLAGRAVPQRLLTIVAPTPGDAERWLTDLAHLTDEAIALYPQREALGEDEPHYEIAGERAETIEALLQGRLRVLVTTARATAERTLMPAALERLRLRLATGERRPPGEVADALERMGYRRVPTVTEVAEFSVRGGILDVYGFGMATPARLEWWGDDVSSIRGFDLTTQRSLQELPEVTVLPINTQAVGRTAAGGSRRRVAAAQAAGRAPPPDATLLELLPPTPSSSRRPPAPTATR